MKQQTKKITIKVSQELYGMIDILSDGFQKNLSDVVRQAIREMFLTYTKQIKTIDKANKPSIYNNLT